MPPRWKASWRNWECSGLSRDQERPKSNHNPNPRSEQRNTGRTTRYDLWAARKGAGSGWRHLGIARITKTATAVSGCCHLSNVTAAKPSRFAGTVLLCTKKPTSAIHAAGHDRSAVWVSLKWFGSTHNQQKLNTPPLH